MVSPFFVIEMRSRDRNHTIIFFATGGRLMGTASGNPRSAGGLSALRDFAALVDLAGEFIGVWDLDRRPLFVNPSGLELVGLDCLESALALRADDLFFPEDRDRVFGEFFSRVLEQGRGEMEVRFRHFKTGEPIWMLYTNLVLRDSEGRPELIATVSRDITKYRRDAAIAEEQTVQLQVLVDALPGLFAHVDGDLRYTWVNRGHAEFFRTTVADTIGKPVREMVSEDVYEVVAQNLHRAIAGESQCFDIELTPSGSDTAEYVRSMYVPDGTGSGCFAMAFDIT
ncbi:MAG: PAS domain-containing protein, partial [Phycisphaerales bacterium]